MVLASLAVAAGKARGELSDTDEAKRAQPGRDSAADVGSPHTEVQIEKLAREFRSRATCSISAAAPAIRWRWKAR